VVLFPVTFFEDYVQGKHSVCKVHIIEVIRFLRLFLELDPFDVLLGSSLLEFNL